MASVRVEWPEVRLIQQHFDLQPCHTMACVSVAEQAAVIHHRLQLCLALEWARARQMPVQVLGEGSNVLVGAEVPGLTLLNRLQGVRWVASDKDTVTLDVASGVSWHWWVCFASAQGWHGLENLALIPGTVGAAPVQNVGAYGVECGDFIERVTAVHFSSGEVRQFGHAECQFAYRDSVFKHAECDQWFITSVRFVLKSRFSPVLSYRPLDELIRPTPQALIRAVIDVRQSKLPDPEQTPNAGSFFTNPIVDSTTAARLKKQWPDMPVFYPPDDASGRAKIAAGWLIEQCGWRGFTDPDTGVGTYPKQALVLTNIKRQPRQQVLAMAERIRLSVQDRFDVLLEQEPRLLG